MLQIVTQTITKEEAVKLMQVLAQLTVSLSAITFINDALNTHAHEGY